MISSFRAFLWGIRLESKLESNCYDASLGHIPVPGNLSGRLCLTLRLDPGQNLYPCQVQVRFFLQPT